MNKISRGNTLDGVKRYHRRRIVKIEKIFGRDCYGVDRSDSLIIVRRTEEVHRSDGTFSLDVHEDCFCSDKINCRHDIMRTDYEEKTTIYDKCPHSEQLIKEVNRVYKVYEGRRTETREPNVCYNFTEEGTVCNKCQKVNNNYYSIEFE